MKFDLKNKLSKSTLWYLVFSTVACFIIFYLSVTVGSGNEFKIMFIAVYVLALKTIQLMISCHIRHALINEVLFYLKIFKSVTLNFLPRRTDLISFMLLDLTAIKQLCYRNFSSPRYVLFFSENLSLALHKKCKNINCSIG